MSGTKKHIKKTKISLTQFTLGLFLEEIRWYVECMGDEALKRCFLDLYDRYEEIEGLPDWDVENTYVVMEQIEP